MFSWAIGGLVPAGYIVEYGLTPFVNRAIMGGIRRRPDSLITWPRVLRIVTLWTILILGFCYIVLALFNRATNPEPQPDLLVPIAKMVTYLVLVAVPHRWATRSGSRFVVTLLLLCIPVGMSLFSLASDIGGRISTGSASLHFFSTLQPAIVGLVFYSVGPLSLLFSWRYGRKTALNQR
jgi:hypothetical protein